VREWERQFLQLYAQAVDRIIITIDCSMMRAGVFFPRMNRKREIIVIDDDDDDEDETIQSFDSEDVTATVGVGSNAASSSSSTAKVVTFMEVANVVDRKMAVRYLRENNNDLQLAIASFFERQSTARGISKFGSNQDKKRMGTAATKPHPRAHSYDPQQENMANRSCDACNEDGKLPAKTNVKKPTAARALREEWKAILDTKTLVGAPRDQTHFVDAEFPPIAQSLDGRKRTASSADAETVHCHCSLPAAAKQVQSDGPNYGRFYLCCGQKQKRQSRWLPAPDTERADSKTTSMTQQCNFFRWDKDGSIGAGGEDGYGSARFSRLAWQRFGLETGSCLYDEKRGIDASQVQQGSVGNCWFLSALAVVAEKPYLIRQVMSHSELNPEGKYSVNFCLDGKWTSILVDSSLPVVVKDIKGNDQEKKARKRPDSTTELKLRCREGIPFHLSPDTLVAFPAFCATPRGQLWPALVEKAYAKAHGSYSQLSGGFIAEGLFDLTGAPFETLLFSDDAMDRDELWSRLKSFNADGFLMGVATSKGGDGLVGGHAYSVLDVIEVPDKLVGEQSKVTDFFRQERRQKRLKTDPNEARNHEKEREESDKVVCLGTRATIRLVRIRNPWGKKEWKASWSAKSELWTKSLRKIIGPDSYKHNDGTFFMSFDDMVDRFHHMDVGKTRKGWIHDGIDAFFRGGRDPLQTSDCAYRIVSKEDTPAFVSIVQQKKRAQTGNTFWYIDPAFIVLRRKLTVLNGVWEHEASSIVGVKRVSTVEVLLSPEYEYVCLPFSCIAGGKREQEQSPFRLCTYSASSINISAISKDVGYMQSAASLLHGELLRSEHHLSYPCAQPGLLACFQCQGCVYFSVINGSSNNFITMKFKLKAPKGIISAFGGDGDTHDIPPRSQRVIAWASGDGKFSAATSLSFTYLVDTVPVRTTHTAKTLPVRLGMKVPLSTKSEELLGSMDASTISNRGGDTIDTYLWIPQIGSVSFCPSGLSRHLPPTNNRPNSQFASDDYGDSLRRNMDLTHEEKKQIFAEARRPEEALKRELNECKEYLKDTDAASSQHITIASRVKELESKLIPAAEHNASQYVFHLNNSAGDLGRENILDLHGLRVKEAKRKLEELVLPVLPVVKRFRLIVGKGSHSEGKSAVLREAICKYIKQHDKRSNIEVKVDKRNPGMIVLTWKGGGGRRKEIVLE